MVDLGQKKVNKCSPFFMRQIRGGEQLLKLILFKQTLL